MKYNIKENNNKVILEVELLPYRKKGNVTRQHFDFKKASEVIKENNYLGYTLDKDNQVILDNKFRQMKGTYTFTKENVFKENNVDNIEEPVLKSSKRRRRKSINNTGE
jgi:hypothetical protein